MGDLTKVGTSLLEMDDIAEFLNLTEAGRTLAEKTIARVVRAEAAAIVSRMARTEQRLLLWS